VKVLLVNSHGADLAYGGAERYVADLRDGLARHGDEVTVLSAFPTRADGSAQLRVLHATDWREDPVRRVRNRLEDWVAVPTARLRALVAELAPDVVHTSNLFGFTTALWEVAHRQGIPVVHTLHDYQLLCPRTSLLRRDGSPCRPHPLLCGLRTRRLARWAPAVTRVIGVSTHVLAAQSDLFGPATGRDVVLPPLVAVADPAAPGSGPPPPALALRTLGFTGALDLHKGVEVLLDAGPRLAELGVTLRVAGGGPLQDRVAATPGIDYAGRLVGEEVGAFLAACDAGVVPSLWAEPGLTFSALEWLGAGRPVLATARGGLAELPPAGVVRLTGDAGDLVARVAQLQAPDAWASLTAGLPVPRGDEDRERWVAEHRHIHARAAGHASAAMA
jgi:glycosyltransferase involved in cell wall biosynthesis